MDQSFDKIVRAWLLHYDHDIPRKRKERTKAFKVLLDNLEDYGYKEQELTKSRKEFIISFLVNPTLPKDTFRSLVKFNVDCLEDALLIKYSTIKIREDGITPEIEDKLDGMEKKAEERRNAKKKGSAIPSTEEENKVSVEDSDKNTSGYFDITDEMRNAVEYPETIWNDDLGLEDEQ